MYICVKLPLENLSSSFCPPHPTSIYTWSDHRTKGARWLGIYLIMFLIHMYLSLSIIITIMIQPKRKL